MSEISNDNSVPTSPNKQTDKMPRISINNIKEPTPGAQKLDLESVKKSSAGKTNVSSAVLDQVIERLRRTIIQKEIMTKQDQKHQMDILNLKQKLMHEKDLQNARERRSRLEKVRKLAGVDENTENEFDGLTTDYKGYPMAVKPAQIEGFTDQHVIPPYIFS